MRYPQRWQLMLAGTLIPTVALAAADEKYNASYPFRPGNVTGLDALYTWVGSYYNGTTELEFIPLIGGGVNVSLCPNLRGKTYTAEFPSILGVTQKGPFDKPDMFTSQQPIEEGQNPANIIFTMWEPGYNASNLGFDLDTQGASSLEWLLDSSSMSWMEPGNNFNLTLAETKQAPYDLTAKPTWGGIDRSLDVNISSCNASTETGMFRVSIIDMPWWDNEGWNWTYPTINIPFDDRTANLTIEGYFDAWPYVFPNSTIPAGMTNAISSDNIVQGKIRVTFRGVIDSYHSDVLVTNGSTPTWLRTVGFGNNSLNIGYGESSGLRRRVNWTIVGSSFVLAVLAISL